MSQSIGKKFPWDLDILPKDSWSACSDPLRHILIQIVVSWPGVPSWFTVGRYHDQGLCSDFYLWQIWVTNSLLERSREYDNGSGSGSIAAASTPRDQFLPITVIQQMGRDPVYIIFAIFLRNFFEKIRKFSCRTAYYANPLMCSPRNEILAVPLWMEAMIYISETLSQQNCISLLSLKSPQQCLVPVISIIAFWITTCIF